MRLDFFATGSDLLPAVEAFEANNAVQYLLQGMFDEALTEQCHSAASIPNLGIAAFGHRDAEKTYLVIDRTALATFREVPQRRGQSRYSLDLMTNPTGFSFRPSGMFTGQFVIDGYIGTATGNPVSSELCKALAREIRKRFTKIRDYYVGPEALRLMEGGWRLTFSTQTPKEFDLKLGEEVTESKVVE